MSGFPGIYTLGELLCQINQPDMRPIANDGLSLRVEMELLWPISIVRDYPDVEIWPNGLMFSITRGSLWELARQVASDSDRRLPGDAQAFLNEAVPDIWATDPETDADVVERPLRVVQQPPHNPRTIKLNGSEMRPHALGAFHLLHPLRRTRLVVPLSLDGAELVARVPREVVDALKVAFIRHLGF